MDAIAHLAAFWPGGFDKNYPDYLPLDAEYGTLEDLKNLTTKIWKRGMLVMPYIKLTWWNEGLILKKLGAQSITVKNLDGSMLQEKYNGNPGFVVQPEHPMVVARNAETVREFTETAPMDLLFQD